MATDATITDKLYRTSISGHFIYKERNADWYDVLAVSGFDTNGEIRYFNGYGKIGHAHVVRDWLPDHRLLMLGADRALSQEYNTDPTITLPARIGSVIETSSYDELLQNSEIHGIVLAYLEENARKRCVQPALKVTTISFPESEVPNLPARAKTIPFFRNH